MKRKPIRKGDESPTKLTKRDERALDKAYGVKPAKKPKKSKK